MTDDALEIFREAEGFQNNLDMLHPLKLDRWHQGLVGLPDAIYMQYGCGILFKHVQASVGAIRALINVLGDGNLPMTLQEIGRRQVNRFTWYVTASFGAVPFSLTFNQENSTWQLTCAIVPNTVKTVPDFEGGIKKATGWASELKKLEDDS